MSLFDKYLTKLTPLITKEDEAESKKYYRELPVEALWDWLQELERRRAAAALHKPPRSHSEEYRIRLMDLQIEWMKSVLEAKAVHSVLLRPTQGESADPPNVVAVESGSPEKPYLTALGRNIDRLRIECGWSFGELAQASKIDEKLIRRHVKRGRGAYPSTLKKYAETFAKRLKPIRYSGRTAKRWRFLQNH